MPKVALVTDSTAYLPKGLIQQYSITVVPLSIIWDGQTYRDGVDLLPEEFYKRLTVSKTLPTTSQITSADLQAVFERLLAQDCSVLGIFLSSKFSGTVQSALQARENLGTGAGKVAVVDSLLTIMAMGWSVLTAARVAQSGGNLDECRKAAENARAHSGVLFVVDTLEFLRRGGRIGGAQALLGTALNIKPVLEMHDGQIESLEKVRTKGKAMDRIIDLVAENVAGQVPVHLATAHADAEKEALSLLDAAKARMNPVETYCCPLSPVIGAHAGPGTVALTYMAGVD